MLFLWSICVFVSCGPIITCMIIVIFSVCTRFILGWRNSLTPSSSTLPSWSCTWYFAICHSTQVKNRRNHVSQRTEFCKLRNSVVFNNNNHFDVVKSMRYSYEHFRIVAVLSLNWLSTHRIYILTFTGRWDVSALCSWSM